MENDNAVNTKNLKKCKVSKIELPALGSLLPPPTQYGGLKVRAAISNRRSSENCSKKGLVQSIHFSKMCTRKGINENVLYIHIEENDGIELCKIPHLFKEGVDDFITKPSWSKNFEDATHKLFFCGLTFPYPFVRSSM